MTLTIKYRHAGYLNSQYMREIKLTEKSGYNQSDLNINIQLDSSNFDFSHSTEDGRDVRITDKDNTPIPFQIESWDKDGQNASIWIKLSSFTANSTKAIKIYYGNTELSSESGLTDTFDTTLNGLKVAWLFNDGTGTVATDSSGYGKDGTIYGDTEWVDGLMSNALYFDGDGDYVLRSDEAGLAGGSATISAWVKLRDANVIKFIFGLQNSSATNGRYGFAIGLYPSDNLYKVFMNTGSGYATTQFDTSDMTFNEWHLLTIRWDNSTNVLDVFVDGIKPSSINYSITTMGNIRSGGHLSICRDEGDTSRDCEGFISNLIGFNRALSDSEIADLYKVAYNFQFSNNVKILAVSNNDGLTTDGTYLYISNDHDVDKYKLSDMSHIKSVTDPCGDADIKYGGLFIKDGYIYGIEGYYSSPYKTYAVKVDDNLNCSLNKDISSYFSLSANAVVYYNGYWYAGETGGDAGGGIRKIYMFDSDWNYIDVAYKTREYSYGFQGATVKDNIIYFTTHGSATEKTHIYAFVQNSDGTLQEIYSCPYQDIFNTVITEGISWDEINSKMYLYLNDGGSTLGIYSADISESGDLSYKNLYTTSSETGKLIVQKVNRCEPDKVFSTENALEGLLSPKRIIEVTEV